MASEKGLFESEESYRRRIERESNERRIEELAGSCPRKGIFEDEVDYRARIAKEACELTVKVGSQVTPSKGIFESDENYRGRIELEANEYIVKANSGRTPSKGILESKDSYKARVREEANIHTISECGESAPRQGIFEGKHAYRSRIAHDARKLRVSRGITNSFDSKGVAGRTGEDSSHTFLVIFVIAALLFGATVVIDKIGNPVGSEHFLWSLASFLLSVIRRPIDSVAATIPLPSSEYGTSEALAVALVFGGGVMLVLILLRHSGGKKWQGLVAAGAICSSILLAGYGIQRELAGSVAGQEMRRGTRASQEPKPTRPTSEKSLGQIVITAPAAPNWSRPLEARELQGRKLVRAEGPNWVLRTRDGMVWGPDSPEPAPDSDVIGTRFQSLGTTSAQIILTLESL